MNPAALSLFQFLRLALGSEEKASLPEMVDWQNVIDLSFEQGVDALSVDGYHKWLDSGVENCLLETDESLEDLKFEWFGSVLQAEEEHRQYLNSVKSLSRLFSDGGLKTFILKGLTFGECYPVPEHRSSCDVDIYLMYADSLKHDVSATEAGNRLIESQGISVKRDYFKEHVFHYDGLQIENHQFFTPFRGSKKSKEFEKLLRQELTAGERRSLFESDALAPPVIFTALFAINHAQRHFLTEGLTLRQICDWALFRKTHYSEIDWNRFNQVCVEYGMDKFADTLTRVGEFILGNMPECSLTAADIRLLDDTLYGQREVPLTGMRRRIQLVKIALASSWKYRMFSNQSVWESVAQRVIGFFDRNPKLD